MHTEPLHRNIDALLLCSQATFCGMALVSHTEPLHKNLDICCYAARQHFVVWLWFRTQSHFTKTWCFAVTQPGSVILCGFYLAHRTTSQKPWCFAVTQPGNVLWRGFDLTHRATSQKPWCFSVTQPGNVLWRGFSLIKTLMLCCYAACQCYMAWHWSCTQSHFTKTLMLSFYAACSCGLLPMSVAAFVFHSHATIIIIINRISRVPIYHTRWEHRALYNSTHNTHAHTHRRTHTHTHVLDRGRGMDVKKPV